MTGNDRNGKSRFISNAKNATINIDFNAMFKIGYGVLMNKLIIKNNNVTAE